MTQQEPELSPEEAARRWTYSDDGTSAHRPLGNVALTLQGQKNAKPRPKGQWLPTLLFTLSGDRFECEFEVERQIFQVEMRVMNVYVPNIVWRVNYPAMQAVIDGGAPKQVSELSFNEWLEFDMLFLGVLKPWPRPMDEDTLPDYKGEFHRIIYLEGGWLGGDWAQEFVRAVPHFCSFVETKAADLRNAPDAQIIPPARHWSYVAGEQHSIENDRTGAKLIFDGRPSEKIPLKARFTFHSGDASLALIGGVGKPTTYYSTFGVNLSSSVLFTNGWSVDEVDDHRDLTRRLLTLVQFAPPIFELASLAQGIFDAGVHWPPLKNLTGLAATIVTIDSVGLTDDTRYWPFCRIDAGRHASMFRYFDFSDS